MHNKFREQGIDIAGFYYCPFHKDGVIAEYKEDSFNRKPKPGMILQAVKDLDLNIRQSIMIGDKPSDRIELEGLRSIIIKSKYTNGDYDVEHLGDLLKMF